MLGREPTQLCYKCFEQVQNLHIAVVVKNSHIWSVARSWKQRSKSEIVVDACHACHFVILGLSTLGSRFCNDLATTVLRTIRCYHAFTTPISR